MYSTAVRLRKVEVERSEVEGCSQISNMVYSSFTYNWQEASDFLLAETCKTLVKILPFIVPQPIPPRKASNNLQKNPSTVVFLSCAHTDVSILQWRHENCVISKRVIMGPLGIIFERSWMPHLTWQQLEKKKFTVRGKISVRTDQ